MKTVLPKLAFALAIMIVCYPILLRSLWLDEVMLFSNFPLNSLSQIFQPLPHYDQATIPLYSLIMTGIGVQQPEWIRAGSVFFITLGIQFLFLKNDSSWWKHLVLAVIVAAFRNYIVMMSELKHYAFESVGVLIAATWFASKESENSFKLIDLGVLFSGLICGIVTVVAVPLAAGLFLVKRKWNKYAIGKFEIINGLALLAGIGIYYLVIKNTSAVQMANYPWVYESRGFVQNLTILAKSTKELLGAVVAGSTSVALLYLLFLNRTKRALNTVIFSAFFLSAMAVLSAAGFYPARNFRHITWIYAICTGILFTAISFGHSDLKWTKIGKSAIVLLLVFLAARNGHSYWTYPYETTGNRQAVQYLFSKPPSFIGAWNGGQPAIHYYSKVLPGAEKHKFFGMLNDTSIANDASNLKYIDAREIERNRSKPGAWGRACKYLVENDYHVMVASLLSEAPRDTSFYVLASHYKLKYDDSYYQAQTVAMHDELERAGCDAVVEKEFQLAVVYRARCPSKTAIECDSLDCRK